METLGCVDDQSFGPSVHGCRDDFDFTLKFEKIYFSILPTAIFIVFSLLRIVYLVSRPAIVGGTALRIAKSIAITIYTALQLALLLFCSIKSTKLGILFIISTTLALVSALCIAALSFLEHSRSPRPSILLNFYLFVSTLLDVAETRTLWLVSVRTDEFMFAFSRVFTTAVVVKVVLLVLESQEKSKWVRWDVNNHSPEETSGLFSLGAFFWLNGLFLTGSRKVLTLDNLYPLDATMATEDLYIRLVNRVMASHNPGRKPGQDYGLAKSLARTLAVQFLLPVAPRIALTCFQFCQPFLINQVLSFLQGQDASSDKNIGPSKNIGYGLIGASVFVYSGIAVSSALYWYAQERVMFMARGALAGVLYKKTTETQLSAANDRAVLTLMSTDIECIRTGFLNIHELWANIVEVGLAGWLLQRQLGATAFVAPLAVVLCCVAASAFQTPFARRRQTAWMERVQDRVGLTANVISHMKHLKISGLTAPMERLIQKLRVDELRVGSRFRILLCVSVVIGVIPLTISPVITFGVTSTTLDVNTIFTSYSLLILLAKPLFIFFQSIPSFVAGFASLDRIQTFLEKDERIDFRENESDFIPIQILEGGSRTIIRISDGCFGWEATKSGLSSINFKISDSSLTLVVGPVASGKSMVCKALLGETPRFDGHIIMARMFHRKIGYCDQTPYLINASIIDNIVGYAPFNAKRYREVIKATMLGPDLAVLPQGDLTKVGSDGIALSGGQKQRVCIARALYLETNLFIFDDILSGLDADTEEQVFRRVFGPGGLLRHRKATAVLCTHSVRHLPAADYVLALGLDGSIVEQGSFKDLLATKYVQSLGIKISGLDCDEEMTLVETGAEEREQSKKEVSTVSVASVHGDEPNRMLGDRSVFRHYFSTIQLTASIAFFAFGCVFGFLQNWGSIWLKFWSEDITSTNPKHSNGFYIGLYALFQACCVLGLFIACVLCATVLISQSGARLHHNALRTLITAPLKFFTTIDTGVVTTLFSQDLTLIDGELPIALLNLTLDGFSAIALAAIVATSSPFLCVAYPFLIGVLYVIQNFYLKTSRQLRLLDLEAKGPLYTHFLDTIKGIATIRAFGWVERQIESNNRLVDASQRPAYLLAMVQQWLAFTLQLVVMILAVAVITLVTQAGSNNAFTGASLISLMSLGGVLNSIIRSYTMLETSIGAVTRLKGFTETVKPEGHKDEDVQVVPGPGWPTKGGIQISGVSASYGEAEHESRESSQRSQNLVLKDLTLSVAPGEKIAICGRSGSGKSSILLLLLRLLDPLPSCTDNITIDDIPLSTVDRSALRQRIIAVPQDPVFLPDGTSFQTNLDPVGVVSEAECRAVLADVELWAFVAARGGLRAGLAPDTLSQGQKQLFSLARAMLRRRVRAAGLETGVGDAAGQEQKENGSVAVEHGGGGILLLDEVSSSVDQDTDRMMQAIIQREFRGYTILMVSHRLDTVMAFDTVVIMDGGRIVESGRPSSLVDQEGSRFRELWQISR